MAEYISREAFLADRRKLYCADCAHRKGVKNGKFKTLYEIGAAPCRSCGINDVLEDVEDAPAADVAEVVRCKDCEHNYGTRKAPRCDFTEFRLTPNSYCSCGFRKMDESEDENNV